MQVNTLDSNQQFLVELANMLMVGNMIVGNGHNLVDFVRHTV